MQRNKEISVPFLKDLPVENTEQILDLSAENGGQTVFLADDSKQIVWIKSPSGAFQAFLGFVGFGVIVLYVKSSQNCAADSRCIDQLLAMLPQQYSTATLIVCGGIEFALTSAVCAMGAIPAFLKQINKHSGIKKFISGGGIITLASAAAMESMLIVMKAFSSTAEALMDPRPWISLISSYPLNLYGIANIFSKDVPRLISKMYQWVGWYKGESVWGNESYKHLLEEYNLFRLRTENRYKMFVSEARHFQFASNNIQNPLQFLYEANLQEITNLDSRAKTIKKMAFGFTGFIAALGSVTPVTINTFYFLYNALVSDKQKSTLSLVGVAILSLLMGLSRIRTIMEKTVSIAMGLADLNQNLHYQLNPKTTIASWLIGAPVAWFSYAVIKDTSLRIFAGHHEQLAADATAYSIEMSHFILSLQLVYLLLTRFSNNDLYKIQEAVQEVLSMTLEEFDQFVKVNESQLDLYQIKKNPYEDSQSVVVVETPVEQRALRHAEQKKLDQIDQKELPQKKQKTSYQIEKNESDGMGSSSKKQRWAHRLCSWWCKKEEPLYADLLQEKETPQVQRSLM